MSLRPRQIASEKGFGPASEQAVEHAIRLYHARAVQPLVEAARAYQNAVRVYTMPIAGYMGMTDEPARNLREALAAFGKGGDAPTPQPSPDVARLVEAAKVAEREMQAILDNFTSLDDLSAALERLRAALAQVEKADG